MGIYPETQEALREAGGGSFKNERPIAYRAKKVPIECGQAPCALQHQSLDISFSFL